MKRITKAIYEGLDNRLLTFNDCDDISFDKSKKVENISKYLQDYKLGDYVYYDKKLGYNNEIGDPVAVCANEEPDNYMFVVLNHPLLKFSFPWANEDSDLRYDTIPDFKNGYENTQYILENYKNEIKGTIWELLNPNEYIPTIKEIKTIYNNYFGINNDGADTRKLYSNINVPRVNQWSSSACQYKTLSNKVFYCYFENGHVGQCDKGIKKCRAIPLLKIDK